MGPVIGIARSGHRTVRRSLLLTRPCRSGSLMLQRGRLRMLTERCVFLMVTWKDGMAVGLPIAVGLPTHETWIISRTVYTFMIIPIRNLIRRRVDFTTRTTRCSIRKENTFM